MGRAGSRSYRSNGADTFATTYCFEDMNRSDEDILIKEGKYLKGQSWIAALTVISPYTFTRHPSF